MPEALMHRAAIAQFPDFHADAVNARECMHRVKVEVLRLAREQILDALLHFQRYAIGDLQLCMHFLFGCFGF